MEIFLTGEDKQNDNFKDITKSLFFDDSSKNYNEKQHLNFMSRWKIEVTKEKLYKNIYNYIYTDIEVQDIPITDSEICLIILKIILSCKIEDNDFISKILTNLPIAKMMSETPYYIYIGDGKFHGTNLWGHLGKSDVVHGGVKNWKEITIGEWINTILI